MGKRFSILVFLLCVVFSTIPLKEANATPAFILEIIKKAVTKVIRAVDLHIQKLQNKTIWLQNAQKTLENTLSKLKLEEIAAWNEKQKEQYRAYFEELAKVKAVITQYRQIRDLVQKQAALMKEYNSIWQRLRRDPHFTVKELEHMSLVYDGLIKETLKNTNQIALIVESFTTRMSDGERLDLIHQAAQQTEIVYRDLARFSRQNVLLSLQRAGSKYEVARVKQLYGIH